MQAPGLDSDRTALERVAELQRELDALFDGAGAGIAYLSDGRIERANDVLARWLGCRADALSDLPLRELYADAAAFDAAWPAVEAALRADGRWTGERALRRRDGSLLQVRVHKRLVDPQRGTVIASYVDIDERHRAQRAVTRHDERTRAILDSALVGIVTVGDRGIEWMNRSARRMLGGTLAEFLHRPIAVVATDEDSHPLRQTQYREQLADGEAKTFECRIKAADGREFWVVGNAVATRDELRGRQLTYALMDVDTRRRADARIAQAQASLQRIIEAAPLAIVLHDAGSLAVLQINDVAARLARRPAAACIGLDPGALYGAELGAVMRADMRSALQASSVTTREYRVADAEQVHVWDARYTPLAPAGTGPGQLLLVATDVTEQRAAQQARLDAAIAQREMLVQEVHHRIKNNLQGVAGLLQQTAQRRPEVAGVIADVVGQLQSIAEVHGLRVGAAGPLRLRQLVQAVATSIRRLFGRDVVVDEVRRGRAEWALPEAEAIPMALTINELLTNAVKHSRPASGDADEPVTCTLSWGDDGADVSIANRAQLPAGFSLPGAGAGLSGLALVRSLLPPRSATLSVDQQGDLVRASLQLVPPGIVRADPPVAEAVAPTR
jgi:PAS domain S-box-containing protein